MPNALPNILVYAYVIVDSGLIDKVSLSASFGEVAFNLIDALPVNVTVVPAAPFKPSGITTFQCFVTSLISFKAEKLAFSCNRIKSSESP